MATDLNSLIAIAIIEVRKVLKTSLQKTSIAFIITTFGLIGLVSSQSVMLKKQFKTLFLISDLKP